MGFGKRLSWFLHSVSGHNTGQTMSTMVKQDCKGVLLAGPATERQIVLLLLTDTEKRAQSRWPGAFPSVWHCVYLIQCRQYSWGAPIIGVTKWVTSGSSTLIPQGLSDLWAFQVDELEQGTMCAFLKSFMVILRSTVLCEIQHGFSLSVLQRVRSTGLPTVTPILWPES